MSSIEIINNNLKNNLSDPNNVTNNNKFEIIILLKDNKIFKFFKNTNEMYCNIIKIIDEIKYDSIKEFELNIYDNILNQKIYSIKENIENKLEDEFYVLKNYNIYLELTSIDGFLNCSCYLKKKENLNVVKFFTPPNY